jgi:hypothetical protein
MPDREDRHPLTPSVLPAKRPRRNLAAIALAAGAGGAFGAGAIAWSLASEPFEACPPSMASDPSPPAALTVRAPEPAAPRYFGRASFVVHERGAMVVLASELDERWYGGAPALVESEGVETILSRPIDAAQLPAVYRDVIGRDAVAIDESGRRCPVTVGDIRAVAHLLTDAEAPDTASTIADLWDEASPSLAAELDVAGDCGEIRWAMLPAEGIVAGAAPAPMRVSRLSEAGGDTHASLAREAVAALRRLPAARAGQRQWQALGEKTSWPRAEDLEIAVLEDPEAPTGNGAVMIAVSVAFLGCGAAVDAQLSAVWRVEDGSLGDALELPDTVHITDIVGAADANGDGLPELLVREDLAASVLHSEGGRRYLAVDGPQIVSHICRC